jgi:hypothetical protein
LTRERKGGVALRALLLFSWVLVPLALASATEDSYIAGYASAVLEREFDVESATITVTDGVVRLFAEELPANSLDKVVSALSAIRGVVRVEISSPTEADAPAPPETARREAGTTSAPAGRPRFVFLSLQEPLFRPLLADPRWPHFSVALHQYVDDSELDAVGATSFGHTFPLFRGDLPAGQWELGFQAGVFAIFDLDAASKDLINADYWVGVPLVYRKNDVSAFVRLFHQSSHLGDEFVLRNRADRINLSYEQVDAIVSQEIGNWMRIYGGGGYLFDQDPADLEPWSTQFGAELTSPRTFLGELARPLAAVDVQNREETDWDTDVSVRAGVQLESATFKSAKLQLLAEVYDGNSPNGQFYERAIRYFGFGAHVFF